MQETGTVHKINGQWMEVRMDVARPEACAKCKACEILGGGKEMRLRVPAVEGLAVDDQVAVLVPQASPWLSMVLVLGLPIVAGVAGLQFGIRWSWWTELLGVDPELCGALLGIICGVAVFQIARLVDRRYTKRIRVTRLGPGESSETAP